jgi:hypothetical protein
MSRRRDQRTRAEAIRRVLARTHDRLAIASLGDLRRAYEDELTAYGAEIGAEVDRIRLKWEQVDHAFTEAFAQRVPCVVCGGPITDARRLSRRYCSDSCRQRAYRQRQHFP